MREAEHRIFAQRKCLSRDELAGYASGSLNGRQQNSVERHLLDCELCAEALEGMQATYGKGMAPALPEMDPGLVPWNTAEARSGRWSPASLAVAAVLCVALLSSAYLFFFNNPLNRHRELAVSRSTDSSADESRPADHVPADRMRPPAAVSSGSTGVLADEAAVDASMNRMAESKDAESQRPAPQETAGTGEQAFTAAFQKEEVPDADAALAERSVAGTADDAEEEPGSPPAFRSRLSAFYDIRTERQKDAVYMGDHKISPAYILTDVTAAPVNSYVVGKTGDDKNKKAASAQSGTRAATVAEQPARELNYSNSLLAAFAGLDSGDYIGAGDELEKFNRTWPGDMNGIFYRGLVFFRMNEDEKAMTEFNKVIAGKDKVFLEDAQWYKSLLLARAGKANEALEIVQRLIANRSAYSKPATELAALLNGN